MTKAQVKKKLMELNTQGYETITIAEVLSWLS